MPPGVQKGQVKRKYHPAGKPHPGRKGFVSSILLALDSSTRTVGVALYDGIQVLNEAVWSSPDYHTVELAPAVAGALEKAGLNAEDLGAVAVAIGPGSFTGLRVGMALAKGLALVRRLPMVGIPTLDALAAAQPLQELPMAAVLRAGRGRLAVGWYQVIENTARIEYAWQPQPGQAVTVLTPEELANKIQAPTLVCGELSEEERLLLAEQAPQARLASPALSLRRPSFLAELAWKRWKAGQTDDPASLVPIYLHYNEPVPG